MTSDIVYALAALVCYGVGDFIYKRAASVGLPAEYFLMGQAWFFCPGIIVYAALTGTLQWSPAAWWGGVAGLFILIGFYNYARALRTGSVSVIAPVFRLNFIVTAALAIALLAEPLTARKLAGFLLALAAGWLLLGGSLEPSTAGPQGARTSLVQVVIATAAAGAANFFHKLGLVGGATPETLLVAQAVVFTGLVTVMTYAMNGTIRPPAGFVAQSAPAALALIAAFLFLLHGMKHGEASIVVPIAQMGFVIAAVLGAVFFKEAWTVRKIGGLGTAVAALLVLAL